MDSGVSNPIEAVEARIRANPIDREAWRVYADWLLDHGDRRGELIGLELLPENNELRDKIAVLVGKYREDWEPPALPVMANYTWQHGFITAATITDLAQPLQVRSLERLLSAPQARLLSSLQLLFRPGRGHGTKLFKPLTEFDFGKLRRFASSYVEKGDKLVHALVQQPSLRVAELELPRVGITNEGAIDIADCAQLSGLRRLGLADNAIGAEGVEALANAPTLSELEVLNLGGNEIGVAGAEALAASPFLARIERLYVDVNEEGRRALSSSFWWIETRGTPHWSRRR
jgi:uncharacterized protein (TIGR02996 family)